MGQGTSCLRCSSKFRTAATQVMLMQCIRATCNAYVRIHTVATQVVLMHTYGIVAWLVTHTKAVDPLTAYAGLVGITTAAVYPMRNCVYGLVTT